MVEMFPAFDSNLRVDALVERVLALYPIGRVAACRLHFRGINDTYKVETDDRGSFFLRVYQVNWRSREEVETELAMLAHLVQSGVPVAAPILRSDGQAITTLDCPEGERFAVLFVAVPGEDVIPPVYTEERAALYGEAVAKIHRAADAYQGPRLRPAIDLPLLLDRPLALARPLLAPRVDDLSHLLKLADRLRASVRAANGLELGFCHGDPSGGNVGEIDGALAFYDFDCCGWGYRAYDPAAFICTFAIEGGNLERVNSMAGAFLRGYRQCRPLAAVDLAMIPTFVAVRMVWQLGLRTELSDRFGWCWTAQLEPMLQPLRDWEQNFLDRHVDWLS